MGQYINIVVLEAVFFHLKPAYDDWDVLQVVVTTENMADFEDKMFAYISEVLPENNYNWANYEAAMTNNRNFSYLVMTFVYRFITMLSLIAVTSVITTISTGISLRARELAVLRSVGMTNGAMEKMLNYENILYGLKALLFGIPLGFGASIAMYKAIQKAMDFEFNLPVYSAFISIFAVFLLTFTTQKYAKSKVRPKSIVERLRDGNI